MSSNPAVTIGITAVDKASNVLQTFDGQVNKTTGTIEKATNTIDQKTAASSAKFKANLATMAVSAATLAAGIVAFSTSFDTIDKAQQAADKAQHRYNTSLESLNDLQKSGKATANELAIAQEKVRLSLEGSKLATDSYHDTQANFYAQIPLQMIAFGTSAITMFTALTATEQGAAFSTSMLGKALTFLQAHPVIFALSGLAILILLVTTNTFGLRDAIWGLGKTMLAFLDTHFKPLADAIRWFIDGISWLAGEMGNNLPAGVQTASAEMGKFDGVITDASGSVDDMGKSVEELADKIQTYNDYLQESIDNTYDATAQNIFYLQSVDQLGIVQNKTNEQIEFAANFLRDVERDAKNAREENFKLVASYIDLDTALNMTSEELAKQAGIYRDLIELTNSAKDAADNFSGLSDEDLVKKAKRSNLVGDNAVMTSRKGSISYFTERHAAFGMHENLTQDTTIRAHAGERVDIDRPGASGSKEIHVHLHLNGKEIAKVVAYENMHTMKMRGQGIYGTVR